jgi:hypothetical protein
MGKVLFCCWKEKQADDGDGRNFWRKAFAVVYL